MYRYCFVGISREALFGTQIYYPWIFPPSATAFCRSGVPMSWESILFNTGPFHSRKLHTQLFAEIAGLHMLIVHGAIWHHSGTGLSASRQNHSCSFTYYPWCWTPGSIPEHSSGCNATVSTIQVRFLFTPKLFPSCSQRGSGYPGSWFCVRVSPIWIPSNVASGA